MSENKNILEPTELPPSERPILLVPGYTWGAEQSLAPLVDELQAIGHHVVVADYYGKDAAQQVPREPSAGATDKLAHRLLDTILDNGFKDTPLTVVAHSYGALVYNRAMQMAKTYGWRSLVPPSDGTREAIFLAPSGTLENENKPRIMSRYARNIGDLAVQTHFGKAFREQQKTLLGAPITRLHEAGDLASKQVDYTQLANQNVHVHVLGYGSDKVFPHNELSEALTSRPTASTSFMADRQATHSDPLLEAHRNAKVIDTLLQTAEA